MRIVHIEDIFYPTAGYQINILPKYQVLQGHEVYIVTSELEKIPDSFGVSFFGRKDIKKLDHEYSKNTGVKIIRYPVLFIFMMRVFHKKGFYKCIEELNPDIIFSHGDGTIYSLHYIKNKNLKKNFAVIFDSHMLEIASKNRFRMLYRIVFKNVYTPIIKKKKYVFIRTQNDNYVEKCLGIPLIQCPWISVGSDTLLFHPDFSVRAKFRKENNISENDFVAIYAGKLDEAKGGKFFAETFLNELVLSHDKKFVLIIVGSLFNDKYGKEVMELLKKSKNRLIMFETQIYTNLAIFYQSADVALFPKQCSLSFYDVQACGLPVISENNNININRLAYNNGITFQAGNSEDFRKKIQQIASLSSIEYKATSENANNYVKKNFDYKNIANKYLSVINDEIKRQKNEKQR